MQMLQTQQPQPAKSDPGFNLRNLLMSRKHLKVNLFNKVEAPRCSLSVTLNLGHSDLSLIVEQMWKGVIDLHGDVFRIWGLLAFLPARLPLRSCCRRDALEQKAVCVCVCVIPPVLIIYHVFWYSKEIWLFCIRSTDTLDILCHFSSPISHSWKLPVCFVSFKTPWQGRDSAPYPESTPMAGDTTPTILGGPALKSTFQTRIFAGRIGRVACVMWWCDVS